MAKSKPATEPDLRGVAPDGAPVPSGSEDAPLPEFGVPNTLSAQDVAGDLPRACSPLDRVPKGSAAKRFKCRVANYATHAEPGYVLALDAEGARACHVRACGLADHLRQVKAAGAEDKDLAKPVVVVTELAD